jgi:hypothetical protein
MRKPQLDDCQQKTIDEKRAEFDAGTKQTNEFSKSHFPVRKRSAVTSPAFSERSA